MTLLKINRLLPINISIVPLKFEVDIQSQTKVRVRKQKIQYGRQAAILKVTTLKINRLLPMATINMHMKFEIEIPKQTWLMLRKPCRLQTDGRTDGQGESSIPPLQLIWISTYLITKNFPQSKKKYPKISLHSQAKTSELPPSAESTTL